MFDHCLICTKELVKYCQSRSRRRRGEIEDEVSPSSRLGGQGSAKCSPITARRGAPDLRNEFWRILSLKNSSGVDTGLFSTNTDTTIQMGCTAKGRVLLFVETRRRATEHHLPHEIIITQCYLPPNTGVLALV